MRRIIYFLGFLGVIFSADQVVENHKNGLPKVIRTFSEYGKLQLIKESGYYVDGSQKYKKTYKDGEVKNIQRWDQNGNKIDLSSYKPDQEVVSTEGQVASIEDQINLLNYGIRKIKEVQNRQGDKLDSLKTTYVAFVQYYQKMDSLNLALEGIQISIEKMNERLTEKDKLLEESIIDLTEVFDTYKRKTNRDLRRIKNDIKLILQRIEELTFFDKRVKDKYLLDEDEVYE